MKFTLRPSGDGSFLRSFKILPPTDRKKLVFITIFQVLMVALDLVGVIAIGLLVTLSVSGSESTEASGKVQFALQLLGLNGASFEMQCAVLGSAAVLLLIGRTLLSIFFTRRILYFLLRRGAQITTESLSKLLSQSLAEVKQRSSQETLFALTHGVSAIILQVIATSVIWISDFALLVVLVLALVFIDAPTALASFSLFAVISFFLHRYMHMRASQLGSLSSSLNIRSNDTILEALSAFRELTVRNRKNYYVNKVGYLRNELASSAAEMSFMPYVSKYVLETSIVVGAVLIGFIQFIFRDASQALGVIAIFLAAGSRIAPAVLRLQQGLISIRGGLGMAAPTLALLESLEKVPKGDTSVAPLLVSHEGFTSEVKIKNVSYTYPDQEIPAVKNLNLCIEPGTFVAIVGPSGSGKTTLTDLLLGVLKPDLGEIEISGLEPKMAFSKWPGAVAYVPQDVMASSSTLRQNIALGFPIFEATDELVKWAASMAQLEELLSTTDLGFDHEVGENGSRLSGGQRQRLGVARALFTKPKLLVLDEATSALDGETETKLTNGLSSLRGSTTVIVIAHRLSTIRNSDLVIYFDKGEITASGTFNEIRSKIPSFDYQAKSLGL